MRSTEGAERGQRGSESEIDGEDSRLTNGVKYVLCELSVIVGHVFMGAQALSGSLVH
jgi:hypothetical protein